MRNLHSYHKRVQSTMLKSITDFYNKKDLDFRRGDVDPYEFQRIFYTIMKVFGVVDNEPVPAWSHPLKFFLVICGCIGLTMAIFSTYHGIQINDLPVFTEAAMYIIIFSNKLMIIACSKVNLKEYHSFLRAMRSNYRYVCTPDCRYRERFFQNQLLTWKASIWVLIFISGTAVGAVNLATLSLLYYSINHNTEDETKRPLLFPLWSPVFDFGDSPYYEIAFVVFNIVPCAYAFGFMFNIIIEVVWIREITTKADLIIWHIQDILDGIHLTNDKDENAKHLPILKNRMRNIVNHHIDMFQLIDDFCRVYKKLLTYAIELYAPVACFTAYSSVEKMEAGEFFNIMTLLCIAAFIIVLIPSYLCTTLTSKVNQTSEACWNVSFWKASRELRPFIILIMKRSQHRLPLRAAGFHEISLETFSQKVTTAYSMFNMLRQFKK